MRRASRAEFEQAITDEVARTDRLLDQLVEQWREFRATTAAAHPDLSNGAMVAMFCVTVHDSPGANSRTLAGLLAAAIWRIDRLSQ